MKKVFALKFSVVLTLILFFVVSVIPVYGVGPNENFEFNDFLGVVGVPEGYEIQCECSRIDGEFCNNRLTGKYCMYIDKTTNEQFIVGLDCAKNKFQLPSSVYIPDRNGINFNANFLYGSPVQEANEFAAVKALKYFFNLHNWEKSSDGFTINLENLYQELGIDCEEKHLNIFEVDDLRFKVRYLDKDFFIPTFSVCKETKASERFIVKVYSAYDKFCKCQSINNIFGYHNIRFDNNNLSIVDINVC